MAGLSRFFEKKIKVSKSDSKLQETARYSVKHIIKKNFTYLELNFSSGRSITGDRRGLFHVPASGH
jgi:hypothetical protein